MKTTHPQMAWVVFSDETDLPYLKILRHGFRHCYLLMSDGQKWFSVDPLSHMTQIGFHSFTEPFNLPLWLKSQGHTVVKVALEEPKERTSPLMVMTCVETVKRVLGIQNRWLITPWQLYRHIQPNNKKHKTE
jgi:hypothetical protein